MAIHLDTDKKPKNIVQTENSQTRRVKSLIVDGHPAWSQPIKVYLQTTVRGGISHSSTTLNASYSEPNAAEAAEGERTRITARYAEPTGTTPANVYYGDVLNINASSDTSSDNWADHEGSLKYKFNHFTAQCYQDSTPVGSSFNLTPVGTLPDMMTPKYEADFTLDTMVPDGTNADWNNIKIDLQFDVTGARLYLTNLDRYPYSSYVQSTNGWYSYSKLWYEPPGGNYYSDIKVDNPEITSGFSSCYWVQTSVVGYTDEGMSDYTEMIRRYRQDYSGKYRVDWNDLPDTPEYKSDSWPYTPRNYRYSTLIASHWYGDVENLLNEVQNSQEGNSIRVGKLSSFMWAEYVLPAHMNLWYLANKCQLTANSSTTDVQTKKVYFLGPAAGDNYYQYKYCWPNCIKGHTGFRFCFNYGYKSSSASTATSKTGRTMIISSEDYTRTEIYNPVTNTVSNSSDTSGLSSYIKITIGRESATATSAMKISYGKYNYFIQYEWKGMRETYINPFATVYLAEFRYLSDPSDPE